MQENWLPVVGYEGYYEVSDLGRIRSVPRTITRKFNFDVTAQMLCKGRIMKPMSTKFDYLKYGLSRDGKVESVLGHRVVAEAWLPNPDNLPVVHHKDHNKHNNTASNLEWTTHSENTLAAIEAGKHHGGFKQGQKHHYSKFSDKQIEWMKSLHKDGYSYTELEQIFNSNRGYISQVLNGKRRANEGEVAGFQINCKALAVYGVFPKLDY